MDVLEIGKVTTTKCKLDEKKEFKIYLHTVKIINASNVQESFKKA